MRPHRVVITGASGFIGSHLHSALLLHPESALCLVTHKRTIRAAAKDPSTKVVPVSTAGWVDEVYDFSPTCVIHAATRFQVTHNRDDIAPMVHANVEVGTLLLDVAYHCNSRFVTLSTAWQRYEGKPRKPVNLYAATKEAFDSIANFYRDEGLDLRRLFLFDVYGPGDTRKKLVPLLIRAARTGESMRARSGEQLIDLTYIDDVVRGVLLASMGQHPRSDRDAVLRSGAISVREVAEIFERAVGSPVPVVWGALPERSKEMRQDWNLQPALTGWTPTVGLREGLTQTWQSETVK